MINTKLSPEDHQTTNHQGEVYTLSRASRSSYSSSYSSSSSSHHTRSEKDDTFKWKGIYLTFLPSATVVAERLFSQVSVCPRGVYTPGVDTPPQPHPADGHCSGRYASYWNAFLSDLLLPRLPTKLWESNIFSRVCVFTRGPRVTTTCDANNNRSHGTAPPGHVKTCSLEGFLGVPPMCPISYFLLANLALAGVALNDVLRYCRICD